MRIPFLAANWKMYKTVHDAVVYIKEFRSMVKDAEAYVGAVQDAANIAYNLLKVAAGNGITVGPILLGAARPVHIIEPTASVRRIVNMTALAVVDAASERPAGG